MRIVSFLPAATEMLYVLGLEEQLVGRSHECDHPPRVKSKPVISDVALDLSRMPLADIDATVAARLATGQSLYVVDEDTLRQAAPDLLVTQNLCQVCGPAGNDVANVIAAMESPPTILWQSPRTFGEMLEAMRTLGAATDTLRRAEIWIQSALTRVARVRSITASLPPVRTAFLEWLDPLYCGGHWVPQMLEWAGACDRNSTIGEDSVRIDWRDLVDWQPDLLLISPCGFDSRKAAEQAAHLAARPGWHDLPAVQSGRAYALDGNAYLSRPGPRLVEGLELLASLAHPTLFSWAGPQEAFIPFNSDTY